MQTLKCSRWTMLPTTCASRSYCFSFSGAFMALVYLPHSPGEIGVVRGDRLCHRPAQEPQVLGGRRRRHRYLRRRIEVEAGIGADVVSFVHALETEAAMILLPGEERLAGEQSGRVAARGDKFDPRHERAARVLLAKKNRFPHHCIHERRAERPRKAAAFGTHEIDVRFAVDLRAAEKEDVDPALAGEIEELARAFGARIAPCV